MKTIAKSLAVTGLLAVGFLGFGTSTAHAQAFGFGFSTPGVSVGVGSAAYGFYGGGFYPGYPVVTTAPVVVAPRVPYVVPGPFYGPRPFYGPGYAYGRRVYGGYGPYRNVYGRRGW